MRFAFCSSKVIALPLWREIACFPNRYISEDTIFRLLYVWLVARTERKQIIQKKASLIYVKHKLTPVKLFDFYFFFHTDFIFPVLMDVSKRKLNNDLPTWRQLKILRMNKTSLYNSQCVSINVMEFFTTILETSYASIWMTNAWIGKKPRKKNQQKLYFIYSIQLQKFNYKLQAFILRGYHGVYTMGEKYKLQKTILH